MRRVTQLAALHQQRVQQGEEIAAARCVVAQLELCPAALVQRLFVERARGPDGEHRTVGLPGLRVTLRAEVDLAAPELRLVRVRALRVVRHQLIEGCHRGSRVTRQLGGAGELVQRGIARRVVGVVAQQFLVRGDCLARLRLGRGVGHVTHRTERGCLLESQITEPPQRLRLQRGVRTVDAQESGVTVRGIFRCRLHWQRAIDRRAAACQRPERRLGFLARALGRAGPAGGKHAGDGEPEIAWGAHRPPPAVAPSYSEASANCACVE